MLLLGALAVAGAAVVGVLWITAHASGHPAAETLSNYFTASEREVRLKLRPDAGWFYIMAVLFLAPPLEEILFRGCLYGALRKRHGAWPANLIASGIFAFCHSGYYALNLLNVLVVGIMLALVYERTRSLRTTTVLHSLVNLLVVLAGKPWFWLVFVSTAGLALWRSGRCRAPDRPGKGWKIYAATLPLLFLGSYVTDANAWWLFLIADLPVMIGLALYAWQRSAVSHRLWQVYGLIYPVWIAIGLWSSTIPPRLQTPWQHLIASKDPIVTAGDLWCEIGLQLIIVGPALLAIFRLASPHRTRSST